jgi:hypothetical protein
MASTLQNDIPMPLPWQAEIPMPLPLQTELTMPSAQQNQSRTFPNRTN